MVSYPLWGAHTSLHLSRSAVPWPSRSARSRHASHHRRTWTMPPTPQRIPKLVVVLVLEPGYLMSPLPAPDLSLCPPLTAAMRKMPNAPSAAPRRAAHRGLWRLVDTRLSGLPTRCCRAPSTNPPFAHVKSLIHFDGPRATYKDVLPCRRDLGPRPPVSASHGHGPRPALGVTGAGTEPT